MKAVWLNYIFNKTGSGMKRFVINPFYQGPAEYKLKMLSKSIGGEA